jgi:GT2 family glycosyltransferase
MHARISLNDQGSVCGSVIHFFDSPNTIQAIGGNRFNRYTGAAMESEGRFRQSGDLGDIKDIEARIDYLSGCSVMVPRHYLKMNGLMNEEFFLYYEEIDWFTRAGNSFDICIAADARVYHREGGSIGSPALRRARPSLLADFHIFRSKHLFMRKYYRIFLPVCYCHTILEAFKRLARGQFQNALTVLSVVMGRREF